MIFDQYIFNCISSATKIFKKCCGTIAENNCGALIDILVICLIFLTTYVLGEYIKFRYQRFKTTKNITDKDFIYNVEDCPICLSEFTTPIRIDCGHAYCLSCLITYFQTNTFKWKYVCPLCRTMVKNVTILDNYAEKELQEKERYELEESLKCMLKEQYDTPFLICINFMWQNKLLKFIASVCIIIILFLIYKKLVPSKFNVTYNKKDVQINLKQH